MSLTDEKDLATQTPTAPPPPVEAKQPETPAASAAQIPGVSPRSISPAAELSRDTDHLMGVGGNRPAAEERAADDQARTGSITGLTAGHKPVDVAQQSLQAAAGAQIQAAASQPATLPEPAQTAGAAMSASLATARDSIHGGLSAALASLGDIKLGPPHDVPTAQLGTGTPPPAHVVANAPSEPQMARA